MNELNRRAFFGQLFRLGLGAVALANLPTIEALASLLPDPAPRKLIVPVGIELRQSQPFTPIPGGSREASDFIDRKMVEIFYRAYEETYADHPGVAECLYAQPVVEVTPSQVHAAMTINGRQYGSYVELAGDEVGNQRRVKCLARAAKHTALYGHLWGPDPP